jgi:hypothetical protein
MQMGNKIANFEHKRKGKQMGLILHGVIAPPTRHLLKEQLALQARWLVCGLSFNLIIGSGGDGYCRYY